MNILISVIVPVYNVENYLSRCLDSLVSQTIKEIEVIIINDGSTDKSIDIINDYVNKYHNFFSFSQQNSGLSSARNKGLEYATGEFVAFLDSDDWVAKDAYEILYNKAVFHNADIVSCGSVHVFDSYEKSYPLCDSDIVCNLSKEPEFISSVKVAAWDKLFKRDIIFNSDIRFPIGLYYEDTPTIIPWLLRAKKVVLIEDLLIFYRQRSGSITKEITFNTKSFDIYAGLSIIKDFIDRANSNEVRIYEYLFLKKCVIDNVIRLHNYNVLDKYLKNVRALIKENEIGLFNPFLNVKEKTFILGIKYLPCKLLNLLLYIVR